MRNNSITKLDMYDCTFLPGEIRVQTDGTNDPILVDILSEIDLSNGRIFADGEHYLFTGYDIIKDEHNRHYLSLKVVVNH